MLSFVRLNMNSSSALWVIGFSLALAACGGSVDDGNDEAPGGGGSGAVAGSGGGSGGVVSTGGSGGTTTTGGSGGVVSTGGTSSGGTGGASVGGSGGSAGAGECVPNTGGTGGSVEWTCEALDGLTVSDPTIVETDGDGVVSPGETVEIEVLLNETSGNDMMYYPGIEFFTDNPLAKVSANNWLYGIFACDSSELGATLTLDPSIPPGTVVNVTAYVAMLNQGCESPSSIQFAVQVE